MATIVLESFIPAGKKKNANAELFEAFRYYASSVCVYIYICTSQMLDGARDANSDVELGCHHLAGLPDLQ